jgi:hypothetical protein
MYTSVLVLYKSNSIASLENASGGVLRASRHVLDIETNHDQPHSHSTRLP